MRTLRSHLRRFARAQDGVAAIEMSLVAVILSAALINAVEIGRYGLAVMQVNAAAQAGAAAANSACDMQHLPATNNCSGLDAAVAAAVASTSLGSRVTVQTPITEGYYCVDLTGVLRNVSSASNKPADCSSVQNPSAAPGLYLTVGARYTYAPIFTGLTLANNFVTPVSETAMVRLQ